VTSRLAAGLLIAVVVVGAFFGGRASVDRRKAPAARGSFEDGYRSGREAAFSGFDGGWAYGTPYIVVLRRGGAGATYRFARRWPVAPGIEYRLCGGTICTRRTAS
jgi:hypothetical protein